jgi:hypothetical protein
MRQSMTFDQARLVVLATVVVLCVLLLMSQSRWLISGPSGPSSIDAISNGGGATISLPRRQALTQRQINAAEAAVSHDYVCPNGEECGQ